LLLGLGSLGIGIVCGLVASYLFRSWRFLTHSAIKEVLLVFCFGYLAYGLGEIAHMSGIICLLTTGVVFAHYGWFNLSPQGKNLSSATFQVIGFGLEAFVFCYLGLSFFSFVDKEWSWEFILLEGLICIIARFIGTVGLI
jgi:NhaP-type Na+/H+ or K+/H+ antiporter